MKQYSLFVNWNIVNRSMCSGDLDFVKDCDEEMWVPQCPKLIHADLPRTGSGVIEYFHLRLQRWLDEGWRITSGTLQVSEKGCYALLETRGHGIPTEEEFPHMKRRLLRRRQHSNEPAD